MQVLTAIAEHFSDARRILNVVTDTYLFPLREQWSVARRRELHGAAGDLDVDARDIRGVVGRATQASTRETSSVEP